MSQTSHDARAFVRALDALTTQVQRLADTRQTPTVRVGDGVSTTADDGRAIPPGANAEDCPRCDTDTLPYPWICPGHPCAQHPTAPVIGGVCGGCTIYPVPPAPAADEDAQRTANDQRTARRNSIRTLLACLERGSMLTGEKALLRQHVETEIRDADTARAVARSNLRHVQTIVPEIDRLAAELEQAQAAIERVRALADRWDRDAPPPGNRPLTDLRAALDGTEQPTTEAEGCCGKPAGAICVHDVSQPEEQ